MKEKNEIQELLSGVIKTKLQNLCRVDPGSKEEADAIKEIVELYKLRIEETKIELDSREKDDRRIDESEARERDEILRERQFREQMRDRNFRLVVEITGIILPLSFYGYQFYRGLKFEETGTVTSTFFRNLLGRFRPAK
jgi:hypothetical protein